MLFVAQEISSSNIIFCRKNCGITHIFFVAGFQTSPFSWNIICIYFVSSHLIGIHKYETGKEQSRTKGCRQIDKIKQNRFFYGMFYS